MLLWDRSGDQRNTAPTDRPRGSDREFKHQYPLQNKVIRNMARDPERDVKSGDSKIVFYSVCLSVCLGVHTAVFAAAVNSNDIVQQTVRRLGLQTDLPSETAPSPPEQFFQLPTETEQLILWCAVIIGGAVILWSLHDSLAYFGRSRKIVGPDDARLAPTEATRLAKAQVEADDLARLGHYGEAMHVLLLKSLNELCQRLGVTFAVSLTSREILRRVQLSDLGRSALSDIIKAVEQTYYGGRAAGPSDYAMCRSQFDTLRHALAGSGAP
jgi:hypothetical protein